MNKIFFIKLISLILLISVILLPGCSEKPSESDISAGNKSDLSDTANEISQNNDETTTEASSEVITIKEKMFIAQTNEIYYNADDYLGKTISYEGIFDTYTAEDSGTVYYSVIRYGPGCCGFDANAGFEVIWDSEYPQENDWVEVTGILEEYSEHGLKYLRLRLSSLDVLTTRGEEYVSQ